MSLSVLIAGCGDVGTALARRLLADGHKVYGMRRNITLLPQGIQGIAADLADPVQLRRLPACDMVVYCVAASRRDEAGYRQAYVQGLQNLLAALPAPPQQLLFTSSTAVYGQNDHGWVDERSPTEPNSFTGEIMLEAERVALQSGIPTTVLRFSGIYGPGRNQMLRQVAQGTVAAPAPLQYGNRIHRDDCAGILAHLIRRRQAGETLAPVYLCSDDDPAPLHEVGEWLAQQLGCAIRERKTARRAGSKRCANRRLKASGYRFSYPSYRDGYPALIAAYLG